MERLISFQFAQPWWLLLLAFVPLRIWLRGRPGVISAVPFSSVALLRSMGGAIRRNPGRWQGILEDLAFVLLILAMASPRIEQGTSNDKKEGIDIVLAVDTSGSMGGAGGRPVNGKIVSKAELMRLGINEFVDNRPHDRFGMIGFAYDCWLMSPLTLDGGWIKSVLENKKKYQSGGGTGSGTAVGNGIMAALELLKKAKGPSKIIILATDGESNGGVAPLEAAEQGYKDKVRIYVFGMFMGGGARDVMKQVADKTGGSFFNISNLSGLREAYRQIDRLEKSKFEQKKFRVYSELYPWFVEVAFVLLLADWISRHTFRMRIP
ncbi:MAG: VWA domain-containing protein [Verrucomicrobiota bacterium]